MTRPSRVPTTVAVGFLSLDALLLLYGGFEWHRPLLVAAGFGCVLASVLVVLAWRRYRRMLQELDVAHRDMQREIDSLRELVQSHHLQN